MFSFILRNAELLIRGAVFVCQPLTPFNAALFSHYCDMRYTPALFVLLCPYRFSKLFCVCEVGRPQGRFGYFPKQVLRESENLGNLPQRKFSTQKVEVVEQRVCFITIKVCIISFSDTAIRLTCHCSRGKHRRAWSFDLSLRVGRSEPIGLLEYTLTLFGPCIIV